MGAKVIEDSPTAGVWKGGKRLVGWCLSLLQACCVAPGVSTPVEGLPRAHRQGRLLEGRGPAEKWCAL